MKYKFNNDGLLKHIQRHEDIIKKVKLKENPNQEIIDRSKKEVEKAKHKRNRALLGVEDEI